MRRAALLSVAPLMLLAYSYIGAAPAQAIVPLCYADTAAYPVVHSGATISSTGSGHCTSGVSGITVSVCIQYEVINRDTGAIEWVNWTCASKHPSPNVEATVTTSTPCSVGHQYYLRTHTLSYGSTSGGGTVSDTLNSSAVYRTCKS